MAKKRNNSKPTLKSLAAELDTSACTLSRVLNGKGSQYRIATSTQQRILAHVQKADYRPNVLARGLRIDQMQEIGLVLPHFADPFFAHAAECVAIESRKRSFSVQVSVTEDSTEMEIEAIAQMMHRSIAGLIVSPVGLQSEHLRRFVGGSLPIVLVDRCFPRLRLPQISLDNIGAAKLAANHLLDHGHRKFACLQGLPATVVNKDRLTGFRQALRARNIPVENNQIYGNAFTQESGYSAVCELRSRHPATTAILSFSNQITLGAVRALAKAGLKIPDDVSLVSIDEIDGCEFFATPLTVVAQPVSELGAMATEMLFQQIDKRGEFDEAFRKLPGKLIFRNSVRSI